jgi:hypothetical protein
MRFYSFDVFLCLAGIMASGILFAESIAGTDVTLDAAARAEVIDGALKALSEGYIFPAVAKQMEQAIRARQQRKEYDSITNARLLARTLTDHLRDVSHDKHLFAGFTAAAAAPNAGHMSVSRRAGADRPAERDCQPREFRVRAGRAAGRQYWLS